MSGIEDLEGDLPDRREPSDAIVRTLEIVNKKGLHARASAKFVHTVDQFDAVVKVTRDGVKASVCRGLGREAWREVDLSALAGA